MSNQNKGSVSVFVHCAAAAVLLVTGGLVYRHYEPLWRGTGSGPISLPVPLAEFPDQIDSWHGKTMEIGATTEAYMRRNFADDYVSKRFINRLRRSYADLYVVYCASRPKAITGHHPGRCYPANGWIPDSIETSEITIASGRTIPCLIHRLHKPLPDYMEVVVLSFYLVNGKIATEEKEFSGLMGRNMNTEGDHTRYVAQVQISSTTESAVLALGRDVLDKVLQYLPNEQGEVLATPATVAFPVPTVD